MRAGYRPSFASDLMTTVTGETSAAAAHWNQPYSQQHETVKRLSLPTGENKPSWGALFGAASAAYLFVAPFQRSASWDEWVWTGIAFATFLFLYVIGVLYWSRRAVVLRVCIALATLAVAFTAYRPSGIIFFTYVATLGPFAFGGRLAGSVAIVLGAAAVILLEWWLRWPPSSFPYTFAIVSILLGGAMTVVARQQAAIARILKAAERERIARDLHDILGHTLSVIIVKSELAGRLLDRDPNRARREIEEVERISRGALSEVREAIAGYRAGNLATEFDRARSTLETAGIVVDHRCESDGMPVAHERVLVLVLREAVTNVLRHAHAKRCRMSVQRTDDAYQLEVEDDGRGGVRQEGSGMRGIRERVAAIGGRVSWSDGPGTLLTITVPVPDRSEA
jgi:two-component system, NarL family, sensor histidine kinase DesK